MKKSSSTLVYSSVFGRLCAKCNLPVADCLCRSQETIAPSRDGVVRVARETKGRKGKGMTVITGVPLHPEGLKDLARQLKQKCGTGGTVKGHAIEIQGDHRDLLVAELQSMGYSVKKSGG